MAAVCGVAAASSITTTPTSSLGMWRGTCDALAADIDVVMI